MEKNIPDEVRKQIEEGVKELAKKSTAPDKETPDWMETDIRRGAEFGYFLACNSSHPEQGERGELYRWVKASEDWERNLSGEMVRDKFNKWPIPYRSVTKSESFGNKFLRFWLSEFDIHTYQAENVEWLCKLSSPPPEGQDGWKEKWFQMQSDIEKKMEEWDMDKRRRAAQAIQDMQNLIINT